MRTLAIIIFWTMRPIQIYSKMIQSLGPFNLKKLGTVCALFLLLLSCKPKTFEPKTFEPRMISVQTPSGAFDVWTKRFGDNPNIKILLLHGAGLTHEQF